MLEVVFEGKETNESPSSVSATVTRRKHGDGKIEFAGWLEYSPQQSMIMQLTFALPHQALSAVGDLPT